MASLVGGITPVDNFDIFNNGLLDLTVGVVTVATAGAYRITNGTTFDEFTGTFVYDIDGHLISGTITGWRHSTATTGFEVSGLSIDVADFLTQLDTNDTATFLSAVFGGADTMTGTTLGDNINAYGGDDKVSGLGGDDSLEGGSGKDTLDGGAGGDTLSGGADNDSLLGGAGDDFLQGGVGDDTMAGGVGDDIYRVLDTGDKVTEFVGEGDDMIVSDIDFDLSINGANIENLTLTDTAKIGKGNALDNAIFGSGNDDTISGGEGDDTLLGAAGADSMVGGNGDDLYGVEDKTDTVVEEADGGDDTIVSTIDYELGANLENLFLAAGAVNGTGNDLNNTILGNADANTLDGEAGQDTLLGGDGGDTYIVDNAGDKVAELAGQGIDTVKSSVNYVLGANLEALFLTDSATTGTGNKLDNALVGNKLANKLTGLGGNDVILDAEGNDTLDGGAGKDQILGGADNDSVLGGADDDTLQGEAGDDTLDGGAGNDLLLGGDGGDNLIGGNGLDTLVGDGGADTMAGGFANDFYGVDDSGDKVLEAGGAGIDGIVSSIDIAVLADNVEELALIGTATLGGGNKLDNLIIGSDNNDSLTGGLGKDTLTGGLGIDELIGDVGDDVYDVDDEKDVVTELSGVGSGKDTVRSTAATFTLSANVESLILIGAAAIGIGNALANTITGNDVANTLEGAEGNDTVSGGLGDDKLTGGAGTDFLMGGKGSDTYVVLDAGDKVVEMAGPGTDRVIASIDYVLGAYVEELELADSATVGTGNALDNKLFANTNVGVASKLSGLGGADTLQGSNWDSTLDGGAGNDSLIGGDGNEILIGGAGNDTLIGGLGKDTMSGGAGNDLYSVEPADTVNELPGQGIDTIVSGGNFDLAVDGANVENLRLTGTGTVGSGNALNNEIIGNANADSLTGADGNDTLIGDGSNDTMVGGKGDDVYVVQDGGDVVTEDPGAAGGKDTIRSDIDIAALAANVENLTLLAGLNGTGNELNNVITGNDSANELEGKAGDDSLAGGAGEDHLDGGDGIDTLAGGKDNDTYEVDDTTDKIVELAGQGIDLVESSADHTLAANVENLTLGGSAAMGIGNALGNEISGNDEANKLSGLGGNDSLEGEAESDTLDGGAGDDTLIGGDENDSLIGGAGKDKLDGEDGADTMAGGAGDDFYFVGATDDSVLESKGQGTDSVESKVDITTLFDNVENLALSGAATLGGGNALNNLIEGSANDDSLSGAAGNDTLSGGDGKDKMAGNSGNDVYDVDNMLDIVTEQSGEGTDTIRSSIDFDLGIDGKNVENLTLLGTAVSGTGNELANVIIGNSGDNSLSGGDNKDSLVGSDGNDTLDGGTGADTMVGGTDGDSYVVDSVGDKVVEAALTGGANLQDEVDTLIDKYVLPANVERLVLTEDIVVVTGTGNAGDNTILGNDLASNKLFGLGGNDSISGAAGDDSLNGGAGNDTLEGGTDNDSLAGGAGSDFLDGQGGIDTMIGGAGDDTYGVDSADDKVTEVAGQGIDEVQSHISDYALKDNVENLTLLFAGDVTGTGNGLDNRITDISGNATMDGGIGNDTLIGGAGTDVFTGGAGRDHFVINTIADGVEAVTDFKIGPSGDTLDVSQLLSGFDAGTDDPNEFVKFVEVGGDTTVQVDADGAGGLATFQDVAVLQGVVLTNVNQAVVEGNLDLS
jgi:Ca2+-binding RTX toxin-like protein